MIEITLTEDQLRLAYHAGGEWWIRARMERRTTMRPLGATNQSGIEGDVAGAISECAVAIWADKPWDGGDGAFLAAPRGDPPPDVGDWEVRSTWRGDGHLILDQNDKRKGDRRFILCTLEATPIVRIRGWTWGENAMAEEYRRGPKWWMPQADLWPCPLKPGRARAA